jgi:ligand-binding SRPBCC domain-containing protein
MPIIQDSVFIEAPPNICFDLARSIDIHMQSTSQTNEIAISGKTSGFIELGQTVTWRATHFGVRQQLTVRITEMDSPNYFVDEMVKGAFKRFRHTHEFISQYGGTYMVDTFDYTSPLGILGKAADRLFLEAYMRHFLQKRNAFIKKAAEEQQQEK